ncbi:MAG TPA: nucleotidyltransferase domain-containing protein [Nitrospiria bacterium]|nr:nucleotidyltransferase domain-containing protein [Nitrospiria bacterium]
MKGQALKARPTNVSITEELIREIASRIVSHFHPHKIILFGSYAYGKPTPDSDLDLLVIMPTRKRPAERSAEISLKCRPPFIPMEVIVLTPGEIKQRLAGFDPFLEEVLAKGQVLYEAQR